MLDANLTKFYEHVQSAGALRTPEHAIRWSRGILQTLGLNLSKTAKKDLSAALPKELSDMVNGTWWLIHFRNTEMSAIEFQERAARRCGNTDKNFARIPILAVMSGLRMFISSSTDDAVSEGLSPELRALWEQASTLVTT